MAGGALNVWDIDTVLDCIILRDNSIEGPVSYIYPLSSTETVYVIHKGVI